MCLSDVDPTSGVPFALQPWNAKESERLSDRYVWYAAYGSNLLFERFRCYIEGGRFRNRGKDNAGCTDKHLPLADARYPIPYKLYFGKTSKSWDNGGVCFLDPARKGTTLGRIFLITQDQFAEIQEQEGSSAEWYGHILELGEYHGITVRTFTSSTRQRENAPSEAYREVVIEGLFETYGPEMSREEIERYLVERESKNE
jgi:hypothetical protein